MRKLQLWQNLNRQTTESVGPSVLLRRFTGPSLWINVSYNDFLGFLQLKKGVEEQQACWDRLQKKERVIYSSCIFYFNFRELMSCLYWKSIKIFFKFLFRNIFLWKIIFYVFSFPFKLLFQKKSFICWFKNSNFSENSNSMNFFLLIRICRYTGCSKSKLRNLRRR